MTTMLTGAAACADKIADGIYRLSTPLSQHVVPGGFTFNQILVADEEPLLFHTGPRRMFPLIREAMARVMPPEKLRYVALSHVESDECGALNDWLAVAPQAVPVCGRVAAMVSIGNLADRPPRPLADGETLSLGKHRLKWYDAPHLPHGWKAGYLMDEITRTILCGDLFRPRSQHPCDARAVRLARAEDARVHARQRLVGRRSGAASRARRPPRSDKLKNTAGRLRFART